MAHDHFKTHSGSKRGYIIKTQEISKKVLKSAPNQPRPPEQVVLLLLLPAAAIAWCCHCQLLPSPLTLTLMMMKRLLVCLLRRLHLLRLPNLLRLVCLLRLIQHPAPRRRGISVMLCFLFLAMALVEVSCFLFLAMALVEVSASTPE